MRQGEALSIFDPLYGQVRLPRFLEPFLRSPEFDRLSGVRLLNCDSLELSGLSEARRRSHTLGVLHLATRLPLLEFGPDDVKALLYAIVLHDIGTPPFGHTVEYEYIRLLSIDHEEFVTRILNADHHSLGKDHQIGRREIKLPGLIAETGVEEGIRALLAGHHPLSCVLAADIDIDNIDNVFRMAWYLGMRCDPQDAERLAGAIRVDRHGRKILDEANRPLVEEWARLRAAAYGVLFNSARHRQSQAVLSSIMAVAMNPSRHSNPADGRPEERPPLLGKDDWLTTDEELLLRLREEELLKPLFADYHRPTQLPEITFEFDCRQRMDRPTLTRHRDRISAFLAPLQLRIYVTLIPYGEALARKVIFHGRGGDPDATWSVGNPERVYRLHVHVGGGSAKRRGITDLMAQVVRKIDEYADGEEWNIRSRSQTSTA